MKSSKQILLLFMILFGFSSTLFSQGVPLLGPLGIPDDPPAEWTARRFHYMDGNRVKMKFYNHGHINSTWPKNASTNMLDGGFPIVASAFGVDADGIPLPYGVIPDTLAGQDSIYVIETANSTDTDPSGKFIWGYYPVIGYFNPDQDKPAISNDDNSWPIGGWPDQPEFIDENGNTEWNGYFGRGKYNADLESYTVVNDAWDFENQAPNGEPPYYLPRPSREMPVDDYKWGGLGTRIGSRLFQWAHPAVQDVVFMLYDIANVSDYDYNNISMGIYLDSGIGGDTQPHDDNSDFDKTLDLSWVYDIDGLGGGSAELGILGAAYLESPGAPFDNIDNDDDGIVDEARDTVAGHWTTDPLEGPNGTQIDEAKWRAFYAPREPGPHWTGDENQNWRSWEDLDADGVFNPSFDEMWDDVGSDGVGTNDLNYMGPDTDGTETNGKPDFGEPNFGKTDKDESDQVGLTTYHNYPRKPYYEDGPLRPAWDKPFYLYMTNHEFDNQFTASSSNVGLLFSSGEIILKKLAIERFSLALLHTNDKPQNDSKNIPELIELKKTVQRIYNTSYRFVMPPTKPRLTAIPGDGQITLVWDDAAEKSKEPFYDYLEDFEGYKLIKSTEPFFEDARVITNSYGNKVNFLPIAQWDLVDGIEGHAEWAQYNGLSYNLGTETGLAHSYVDKNVQNGRTYFYALIAYDFGMEADGVSPSENTATITLDRRDSVVFVDRNCAMVTPRTYASGFNMAEVDSGWVTKFGSGTVSVNMINPMDVKSNNKYSVSFSVTKRGYDPEKAREYGLRDDKVFRYSPESYYITNVTDTSYTDTLEILTAGFEDESDFPILEGIQISMSNDIKIELESYKWENPSTQTRVNVFPTDKLSQSPWDYTLHFMNDTLQTTPFVRFYGSWNLLTNYKTNIFALNHNFFHKEFNGTDSVLVPDTAAVLLVDVDDNGIFEINPTDPNSDFIVIGEIEKRFRIDNGDALDLDSAPGIYEIFFKDKPQIGQVLEINTTNPFFETDNFVYSLSEQESRNIELAKQGMDNIKVVPNPYIATNLNEPYVKKGLHQRRRLMFTHLPAECSITIYSASGFIVDKVEVNNSADNGMFMWDMQTSEGLEVSYGIYIYYVNAPGIGEKIGKFAIIK